MALFHLLLMLSGDIEVNPGPKSKTNKRTAKSRFISDLNTDVSLAHSDPKELATKYHVNVRTVQRWLGIVYHYDLRVAILFLTNLNCYSSVTSHYAKNITYISDLLGGGSMTTNIPGLHVALIWIMLTTMNWQKNTVFEQQQSTYGRRMRIHNGKFGMNILNN